MYVLEAPDSWQEAMLAELARPKMAGARVRLHDAGDLFSPDYARRWVEIIAARPDTFFYAYTKETKIADEILLPADLPNARWIVSLGGKLDRLADPARHRIADVFPTEAAIGRAGFHSQLASDLLAAFGPTPIGMAANSHPVLKKRQGQRTFGQWQAEVDARRAGRAHRGRGELVEAVVGEGAGR